MDDELAWLRSPSFRQGWRKGLHVNTGEGCEGFQHYWVWDCDVAEQVGKRSLRQHGAGEKVAA